MQSLLIALPQVVSLETLFSMFSGTIVGIIFGAIPGLTYSMGIILLLPLTFGMEAITAIALLLGVYVGGMTGGSVSAILLGIPGTPSSAATCIDGHRFCQAGKAGKALGVALVASTFGGLFSLVILSFSAPVVANFALKFGPAEIFALVFFGFSTISGLASNNLVKGLISGLIGLVVMTIGLDPIMGMQRFTFGVSKLNGGIDLLVFMIGMFAIPQIVKIFTGEEVSEYSTARCIDDHKVKNEFPTLQEFKNLSWPMLKASLMGTGIGALPGSGGPIAAFLGYDQARRRKEDNEPTLEGIAAPEAAKNAVTGGALIPMLTLGIPGDNATAIMMGALLIHGLRPGPLLFKEHPDFIYGLFAVLLIVNIMTFAIQYFGIRIFVRVLRIKKSYLFTAIMTLCLLGAYTVNNNIFDMYIMFFAGVLGYLMTKNKFPTEPAVLALVLGPTMEENFRRSLIISWGDFGIFFSSPISIILYFFTIFLIVNQVITGRKKKQRMIAKAKAACIEPEDQGIGAK